MPKLIVLCLLLLAPALAPCQVKISVKADQITVEVNGKPFTSLRQGQEANKPYLYPVLTASGKPVTRAFPMEHVEGDDTDHPHQRSVWMGYERLSGMNLWEIDPADPHPRTGKIVFRDVLETHDGAQTGGFTISAQWISPEGQPIIDETLGLTFYAEPQPHRMFDIDLRLKAIALVTFEDHRDGILGFRFGSAFDESHGGKPVNAEGIQGAERLDGTHSGWLDWQATLDGEKVGVAVLDYPQNLHHPTTWLTRPYALLFANPFAQRYYSRSLQNGSLSLQPGDEIRLRYRVIIHAANFDVAVAYQEYSAP